MFAGGDVVWRKYLVVCSLLVLVVGACFGCGDDESIRIGLSAPLSGRYSDLGIQGQKGAELAVDAVNARGGVAGRTLKLEVLNDSGTVEGALDADRTLMDHDVVAVVGHYLSAQSLAAVEKFADKPLVFVSPTTSTPLLSRQKDNFFRVMPSNEEWAAALAGFVAKKMDRPSVLMIMDGDNRGYTSTFCNAFSNRYAQLGGEASSEIQFHSHSAGWEQVVVERVAQEKPGALLVAASAMDTASVAGRLRQNGYKLPILITPWAYTKGLVRAGGSAVEGVISSMSYDENSRMPEFVAFKDAFRRRFEAKPHFAAAFSYDAIMALADALERTAGKPAGLARELARVRDLPGSMGPFSINDAGDVHRAYFIVTVKDGELHTLSRVTGE